MGKLFRALILSGVLSYALLPNLAAEDLSNYEYTNENEGTTNEDGYMDVSTYSNDNISYSFNIPKEQGNGWNKARYRETLNNDNAWKVNLSYTGEGKGCASTFWIELDNGENVSKGHDVSEGSGNHYFSAYSTAAKEDVHLTAENNQNNSRNYTVSGYWDEETGHIV